MTPKLFISDVDGTLFDDQHQYDVERFNQLLKRIHQADGHFFIASGNNYPHLKGIFAASPEIDGFIAENGAQIVIDDQEVAASPLTAKARIAALRYIQTVVRPDIVFLSGRGGSYVNQQHGAFENYYVNNFKYAKDLLSVEDEIYKINLKTQLPVDQVAQELNTAMPELVHAAPSGFGSIDVIAKGTNKAAGIRALLPRFQCTMADVVAFGDNGNDAEMLQAAGLGVAMPNATKDLKQIANQVAPDDNNHSGVLTFISNLLDSSSRQEFLA